MTGAFKVGKFDQNAGTMHEYELPTPRTAIRFIYSDDGGNVWFPNNSNNKIGVIMQQPPAESEGQPAGEAPAILTAVSDGPRNSFEARIAWTPVDLGQPNKFHVEVFDANQLEPRSLLHVRYDIKIYKGDKSLRPAELTGNEAL